MGSASALSKIRNRGTIYSTCLEAPILAALIANTLHSSPSGPYQFATALHIPACLFLEIEGMLYYHWIWMTLTAWTGTALALLISSLVKTERAALTSVPLLLVPQILLAGALVPYREMNRGLFQNAADIRERGGVHVPAVLMPLRYAYEGLIVCQLVRNPFEIE